MVGPNSLSATPDAAGEEMEQIIASLIRVSHLHAKRSPRSSTQRYPTTLSRCHLKTSDILTFKMTTRISRTLRLRFFAAISPLFVDDNLNKSEIEHRER